jgi:flagellar P-ring protein precursor FlgI
MAESEMENPMSDPVGLGTCRAMLLGIAMLAAAIPMTAASAAETASLPASAAPEDGGTVILGVGLVVGLPGTGDSAVDDALVENSMVGVLKRAGLDIWHGQIAPGRVATVMITAELPQRPRDGAPLSVTVAAIGDAVSLAGGTLLATPLRDADGKVYAIGQGRIDARAQRAAVLAQPAVLDIGRLRQLAAQ